MADLRMRFLTREWAAGGLTDDAAEAASSAWREHQEAQRPQLPPDIRQFAERLATGLTIHDSFVRRADIDLRRRHVEIVLRCFSGPQFEHQLDLTLRFGGIDALLPDGEEFAHLLALADAEWLYEEIDLCPDRTVEFRVLHWRPSTGHGEHGLRFHRLSFVETPVVDAAWLRVGDEPPTVRLEGRVIS